MAHDSGRAAGGGRVCLAGSPEHGSPGRELGVGHLDSFGTGGSRRRPSGHGLCAWAAERWRRRAGKLVAGGMIFGAKREDQSRRGSVPQRRHQLAPHAAPAPRPSGQRLWPDGPPPATPVPNESKCPTPNSVRAIRVRTASKANSTSSSGPPQIVAHYRPVSLCRHPLRGLEKLRCKLCGKTFTAPAPRRRAWRSTIRTSGPMLGYLRFGGRPAALPVGQDATDLGVRLQPPPRNGN